MMKRRQRGRAEGKRYSVICTEIGVQKLAKVSAKQAGLCRIGLAGSLGAGKTVFARAFIKNQTGIKDAISPSFVLMQEYRGRSGRVVQHWDLYRVSSIPEELEDPCPAGTIWLIEWAGKFSDLAETMDLLIEFQIPETNGFSGKLQPPREREVILSGPFAERVFGAFKDGDCS